MEPILPQLKVSFRNEDMPAPKTTRTLSSSLLSPSIDLVQLSRRGSVFASVVHAQNFTARVSEIAKDTMLLDSFEFIVGVKELRRLIKFFFEKPQEKPKENAGGIAGGQSRESSGRQSLVPSRSPAVGGGADDHSPFVSRRSSAMSDDRNTIDDDEDVAGGGEEFTLEGSIPKALREEEFVSAVHSVLTSQTRREIRKWFLRIDADCTGSVGWDEFSSFLLTHGHKRQTADVRTAEYATRAFPTSCPISQQHRDPITSIVVHPRTGRVFTGSEDGSVRMWDSDSLLHQRLIYNGGSWITGMCLMKNAAKFAICSVDRRVVTFDSKTGEVLRIFGGRLMMESDAYSRYIADTVEVVEVGNMKASHTAAKGVRTIGMNRDPVFSAKNFQALSFDEFHTRMETEKVRRSERKKLEKSTLAGLLETPTCIECYTTPQGEDAILLGSRTGVIQNYVLPSVAQRIVNVQGVFEVHGTEQHSADSCVNMIKSLQLLNGFLSCSDDKTIRLSDFQGRPIRVFIGHDRSVRCIDVSEVSKIIVSGGADRAALLWDPLSPAPIYRLRDEVSPISSPLIAVSVNDVEKQIVCVNEDAVVKVWDLRTYHLLQEFQEKHHNFSSIAFDVSHQRIIGGSTFPVQFQLRKKAATFPSNYIGHTTTVLGSLFNVSYEQLVSLDNETVIVWQADTGAYSFSFSLNSFHALDDCRLTAFSSDGLFRRLLTGFHNGVVAVWNYSNGQALNIIHDVDTMAEVHAVTALMRMEKTFYVCAVGKKLLVAHEAQQFTITQVSKWSVPDEFQFITTLQPVSSHTVACGTFSGAILFFHVVNMLLDGRPLRIEEEVAHSPSIAGGYSSETSVALSAGYSIEKLVSLSRIGDVVLACHSDGRIALWHTVRRSFHGCVSLSSSTGATVSNITVDEFFNDFLAHNDEMGNVFIWKLQFVKDAPATCSAPETFSLGSCSVIDSFLACENNITDLTFVRLVTPCIAVTSTDATVRCFTLQGACLGHFGLTKWKLSMRDTWMNPRKVPATCGDTGSAITVEDTRLFEIFHPQPPVNRPHTEQKDPLESPPTSAQRKRSPPPQLDPASFAPSSQFVPSHHADESAPHLQAPLKVGTEPASRQSTSHRLERAVDVGLLRHGKLEVYDPDRSFDSTSIASMMSSPLAAIHSTPHQQRRLGRRRISKEKSTTVQGCLAPPGAVRKQKLSMDSTSSFDVALSSTTEPEPQQPHTARPTVGVKQTQRENSLVCSLAIPTGFVPWKPTEPSPANTTSPDRTSEPADDTHAKALQSHVNQQRAKLRSVRECLDEDVVRVQRRIGLLPPQHEEPGYKALHPRAPTGTRSLSEDKVNYRLHCVPLSEGNFPAVRKSLEYGTLRSINAKYSIFGPWPKGGHEPGMPRLTAMGPFRGQM